MGLEAATYIDGLNASNPIGTDDRSTADDHLRLIKSVLKNTFPNLTGAVTSTQAELNKLDGVTASVAELNYVAGVTSAIQTQIDGKFSASGTLAIANGGTGATAAAQARTNLGLGSLSTLSTINNGNWSGTALAIGNGGTGSTSAATARTALGVGVVGTLATVSNAYMAADAIKQANINTSTSAQSQFLSAGGNAQIDLNGGDYCFYVGIRRSGGVDRILGEVTSLTSVGTAYASTRRLYLSNTDGSNAQTAYVLQRYVTASPPYSFGGGDIPLFVMAEVAPNGDVLAAFAAEDPPWAYNGPTNIAAQKVENGKAYRYQRKAGLTLPQQALQSNAMLMKFLEDRQLPFEEQFDVVEIDYAFKNSDMNIVPHLFGNVQPGSTIVMVEPTGSLTLALRELHQDGENICDLLHTKKLKLGTTPIVGVGGPTGVVVVSATL